MENWWFCAAGLRRHVCILKGKHMCGSARVYPDNIVFTTRKKQPLPIRPITACSFTAAHFDLIIQGFFPPLLFPPKYHFASFIFPLHRPRQSLPCVSTCSVKHISVSVKALHYWIALIMDADSHKYKYTHLLKCCIEWCNSQIIVSEL